uniref:Bifunctional dihydrofolate reductase-thymidylate synthase n=2 Tax=Daucus carota TaxID=4039 RepID=Q39687_DAUCA|nr:dihydrofolate reductase-thymidylate synthetase precursor [Daucus carota]
MYKALISSTFPLLNSLSQTLALRSASLYLLTNCNLSSSNFSHCHRFTTYMASERLANPTNGSGITRPDPQRTYQVVVAATQNMGIGKDGKLPWRLPSDMKFFKDVTMTTSDPLKRNAVIMGRKTWESIPIQHRPLPGRLNVVLTRSGSFDIATVENVVICGSMISALELLAGSPYCVSVEKVFVIGGGQIYREALNAPGCDAVHITEIEEHIECDTFIPLLDESVFQPWYSSFPLVENKIRYCFTTYVRVRNSVAELTSQTNGCSSDSKSDSGNFEIQNFSFLPKTVFEKHEEYLYLGLVENIISNGVTKNDRTRTGTVSIFGCQMRFNLRKSFPLLTTKKVFWRGVVEELLWFISGSTNAKILKEKGVNIWEGNGSREYLDSIGLTDREEGDLGPIYGFQWRHFGARYTDMHADYSGQGFDQLLDVISKIKNNPDDRRIIQSAWNPSDLRLMALPPCHMFAQFYVANGELSCQMYQRSADMGLGVPFNIAAYALLTCMIAHVCDLVPGDFVHSIGDAHVYSNHLSDLFETSFRMLPKTFPVLKINSGEKDIDSFEAADFKLIGYDPHQKIEMKMAV